LNTGLAATFDGTGLKTDGVPQLGLAVDLTL
jgi:hypothetical protein